MMEDMKSRLPLLISLTMFAGCQNSFPLQLVNDGRDPLRFAISTPDGVQRSLSVETRSQKTLRLPNAEDAETTTVIVEAILEGEDSGMLLIDITVGVVECQSTDTSAKTIIWTRDGFECASGWGVDGDTADP